MLQAAVNAATDLTVQTGTLQSDTTHMYGCHTVNRHT